MLLRCITLLHCHVFPHHYLYTQHRLSTCDVMMFCHIGWHFDHNARKSPLRGDGERKRRGDLLSQNLVTKCCYKMLSQNVVIECCHKMSSQNIVTECCHKMFSQNALCIMQWGLRCVPYAVCSALCPPVIGYLFILFPSPWHFLYLGHFCISPAFISPLLQIQDRMLLVTESLSKKLNVLSPKCQKNLMHRCRREKVWPATATFIKSHSWLCLSLQINQVPKKAFSSIFNFSYYLTILQIDQLPYIGPAMVAL